MDQDSFRKLLQTPRPGGSSTLGSASGSRGIAVPSKKKTVDASQPAFKPRNVKKTQESKYRDRATERRAGGGNDYAHIEAVLEDFEKKHADEDREKVEAQRKYLGGDSEHSVLVKGLDFALLEQNKARSTLTNEDLDALDQAYLESSSTHKESTVPRKRTRAELLQELKDQRAGKPTNSAQLSVEEEAKALEEAKQKGKFKPIGFKPIGQPEGKKKKLKSDSTDPEKKKKRKLDGETLSGDKAISTTNHADSMPPPPTIPTSKQETQTKTVEQEPVDGEFDIFADAGEYKGIDVDDDDDDDENLVSRSKPPTEDDEKEHEEDSSSAIPRRWIETDEHDQSASTKPSIPLPLVLNSSKSAAATSSSSRRSPPQHHPHREAIISDDEEMEDDDKPVRLVPLASSALPSIKDFLAMDKAAGSYDKKKKRKDKKKNGGGDDADGDDDDDASKKKTMEAKVDRDYKRLKTYTDKKAASGSK